MSIDVRTFCRVILNVPISNGPKDISQEWDERKMISNGITTILVKLLLFACDVWFRLGYCGSNFVYYLHLQVWEQRKL